MEPRCAVPTDVEIGWTWYNRRDAARFELLKTADVKIAGFWEGTLPTSVYK
jgi:hypothetical protein